MNRLIHIYCPGILDSTPCDTSVGSSFTVMDQRECLAECSFYQSSFSDEGNTSGFSNSKAQRKRFAEYYDFSATNATVRDEETGFGYFGARYMEHELMTMWLSVDPMSDKYPSISPYAYCAWNPILYVDPSGEEKMIWYRLTDIYSLESFYRIVTQRKDNPLTHKEALNEWVKRQKIWENNKVLYSLDKKYQNTSATDHLFCHGSKDQKIEFNNRWMSAFEFGEYLREINPKKYNGKDVAVLMLHSCMSGSGKNSFAEQLSTNLTNCIVIAATNNVAVDDDGNEYVECGGRWNVYYNGKIICYTPGSVKQTKYIEKIIEQDSKEVYRHYETYINKAND